MTAVQNRGASTEMAWGNQSWDPTHEGWHGHPVVRMDAIGEGWELFKQRWGTWMLTALLVLFANGAVTGAVSALFRVPPVGGGAPFRLPLPPEGSAIQVLLSMFVNGLFLGGMFRMACLQVRGQPIDLGTFFGVVNVLPHLLLGSAIYGLALLAGAFLLVVPLFIVAGLLMFTFPLIVDAGLPATEAIGQSYRALKSQWFMATMFHIIAWFLAGIGTCLCCVGLLFTAPLYCLSITVLYRDFFLAKGYDAGFKPSPPEPEF